MSGKEQEGKMQEGYVSDDDDNYDSTRCGSKFSNDLATSKRHNLNSLGDMTTTTAGDAAKIKKKIKLLKKRLKETRKRDKIIKDERNKRKSAKYQKADAAIARRLAKKAAEDDHKEMQRKLTAMSMDEIK